MEAECYPGQEEARGWLGSTNRQLKQFLENECFLFFVRAPQCLIVDCPPRPYLGPGAGARRNSNMEAEAPTISPFQELFSFPFLPFSPEERGDCGGGAGGG